MKKIVSLVSLGCILICLSSCEGNKVKDSESKIRFINASYLSGDVSVCIDYKKLFATDIQYLNYSLFSSHISSTHVIQVKDVAGNLLKDTSLLMLENATYTAIVYDQSGIVKFKIIQEDFSTPVGSFCKLRFLHLSNNAPNTDITAANDATVLFQNYANGDHSDYIIFPTDSTFFKAHDTGNATPYYIQPHYLQFKAGYFYTMYLRGNIGSSGTDSLGFFVIENNGNY